LLLAWRRRGSLLGAADLGTELGAVDLGAELGAPDLGAELGAVDLDAELATIPPWPVFFPEITFILLHPSRFFSPSPLALPFQSTYWTLETSNQSIHLQEQGILSPLLNLYVLISSSLYGFLNVATLLLRV